MKYHFFSFLLGKIECKLTSGHSGFLGFQSLILTPSFFLYQGSAAIAPPRRQCLPPLTHLLREAFPCTSPGAANSTTPASSYLSKSPDLSAHVLTA